MRTFFVICLTYGVALFGTPGRQSCSPTLGKLITQTRLHLIAPAGKPWETLYANSEQRQPYYIGSNPREMVLSAQYSPTPMLSFSTKELAEIQSQQLLAKLGVKEAEFEIWPMLNDEGDRTWVFARWRKSTTDEWRWMDKKMWAKAQEKTMVAPELPISLRPAKKGDASRLFDDLLSFNSLYQKPLYGDAIWTTHNGRRVLGAWLPLEEPNQIRERFSNNPKIVAKILPQPARFNDKPISFILKAGERESVWKEPIQWVGEPKLEFIPPHTDLVPHTFAPDFESKFQKDIEILSGQEDAIFPLSGKKMRFTRKSSAQTDNQLESIAQYLTERYHSLGLEVISQPFEWRHIPQSNLIVVIPGTDRSLPPLVFADHYDTAFAEDVFEKSHKRVSNPGADDNGTATASLLRAAEELKQSKPKRDIWLLHLTGEEYPADDLGVRHFMKELMKEKKDIAGMVLIDMIGIRDPKDPVFQINGGQTPASLALAGMAMKASEVEATGLTPTYRARYDQQSYLYNTDGYILDSLGYPIVFFNEHLNRHTLDGINQHYHKTSDLPKNIDWKYATKISKSAILTVLNAASK